MSRADLGLYSDGERPRRAAEARLGEDEGLHLLNGRIKATFEHPFLVRRDEEWGFCSAELLRVGDRLIVPDGRSQVEERIDSLERIDGRVRTVAIRVPGTNTYLADGVWTHNDAGSSGPGISQQSSSSGSSSGSGSGSSKSSGSSFSSSASGTIVISNTASSSGSSSGGGSGLSTGSGSGVSGIGESGKG